MNLPNKLTVLRIVLVPFVLIFMLPVPGQLALFSGWNHFVASYGQILAIIIFIAASLTDMLDGAIARSQILVALLQRGHHLVEAHAKTPDLFRNKHDLKGSFLPTELFHAGYARNSLEPRDQHLIGVVTQA